MLYGILQIICLSCLPVLFVSVIWTLGKFLWIAMGGDPDESPFK